MRRAGPRRQHHLYRAGGTVGGHPERVGGIAEGEPVRDDGGGDLRVTGENCCR